MRTIFTIVKKELKRFFSDPRMLVSLFLPGILIYGIYSVMGGFITDSMTTDEYNIYIENLPNSMKPYFDGLPLNVYEEELTKEEINTYIKDNTLDLYISFEDDFDKLVNDYIYNSNVQAPNIDIIYNTASISSSTLQQILVSLFDQYEATLTNKFNVNSVSLATDEDTTMQTITMMLPFLLIVFLFTGAMSICADSIAGEKERGTIATLLITPTKRSHIVLGKVVSLGITALASAIVSALGLFMSLPKLLGTEFSFSMYGVGTLALALIIIILTVLLFTTVLTMVSTYARTIKEATSLSTPLMIIIMLISMSNLMNTTASTSLGTYFVPVLNVSQCLVQLFSLSVNPITFIICILSNTIYIAIGVYIITKIFNNEHIIFNN